MNATTEPIVETETLTAQSEGAQAVAPSVPATKMQAETETTVSPAASAPQNPAQQRTPSQANSQDAQAASSPVISADAIRAEAAEVAQVCAQASRLGVQIDAADAVKRGLKPEALRAQVLNDLATRSDAAAIMATAPAAAAVKDSPLVAAARKAATDAAR